MLSGETSVGDYPVEAVQTMARIVASTEQHGLEQQVGTARSAWDPYTNGGIIAKAAAEVAERVGAKYLVAFTQPGTPRAGCRGSAARSRSWPSPPRRDPLPAVDDAGASRRSRPTRSSTPTRWSARSTSSCCTIGRVAEGELVVIIAGSPPGIPGSTNALRIHRMGDAIDEVAPAYRRTPADGGPDADGSREALHADVPRVGFEPTLDGCLRRIDLCRWATGA